MEPQTDGGRLMRARVYRLDVMVVDFDNYGHEDMRVMIENALGMAAPIRVQTMDYRDVEWSDEHLLNQSKTQRDAFIGLFEDGDPQ